MESITVKDLEQIIKYYSELCARVSDLEVKVASLIYPKKFYNFEIGDVFMIDNLEHIVSSIFSNNIAVIHRINEREEFGKLLGYRSAAGFNVRRGETEGVYA